MFINLADVFSTENKVLTLQAETDMTEISAGGGIFQITEKSPVHFTVTNIGKNKAVIAAEAEITLAMSCDRCLEPVEEKLTLHFSREACAPDTLDGLSEDEEDQGFMEGYQLNVEGLLYSEIMINLPMKVLCRPDCKGICPKCGMNLNTGTCECDTFVPDPRMAVIKDIFDTNKEV